MKNDKVAARIRRKKSIRNRMTGTPERPRLSVFRSNLHIYAQMIDDIHGSTVLSLSSNSSSLRDKVKSNNELKGKTGIAFFVGEELGKIALESNISEIVFDRNGYLFHGRVKALAEGARKAGLKF